MNKINWIDHLLNFVSVILGVSLAFYVSSWSEKKKNALESSNIASSLIQEIERDIRVYERGQLVRNKKQSEGLQRAIEKIRRNDLDSLPFLIQRGIGFSNYYPQRSTFNSITSSGKFGLIDDHNLQVQISSFYESTAYEAKFRGEAQMKFYNEHLIPLIIESTDLLNPDIKEIDLIKLTNLLLIYQNILQAKLQQYEQVVLEGTALKDSLNTYKNNLQ